MYLSALRSCCVLAVLTMGSACTVMDMESTQAEDQAFGQPKPVFPESEYQKGHEGWVMVGYEVAPSGLVSYAGVLDSSGNEAFERAATDALAKWRFAPGDLRQETGLVNFEFDQTIVQLSRRFTSLNRRAHDLIEDGDLEAAEEMLEKIRSYDDLTVYDLAYSFLTEGRIAGARGDHAGQLRLFRKAVQSEGRWLDRRHYLAALRAIVIMEIEQQDYASAVRDFELLSETSVGRERGADLEDLVLSIDEQLQEKGIDTPPYMAANISVTVERLRPTERDPIKEKPSDRDRGAYPPMRPSRGRN